MGAMRPYAPVSVKNGHGLGLHVSSSDHVHFPHPAGALGPRNAKYQRMQERMDDMVTSLGKN